MLWDSGLATAAEVAAAEAPAAVAAAVAEEVGRVAVAA